MRRGWGGKEKEKEGRVSWSERREGGGELREGWASRKVNVLATEVMKNLRGREGRERVDQSESNATRCEKRGRSTY